jgi:hypothetical protein
MLVQITIEVPESALEAFFETPEGREVRLAAARQWLETGPGAQGAAVELAGVTLGELLQRLDLPAREPLRGLEAAAGYRWPRLEAEHDPPKREASTGKHVPTGVALFYEWFTANQCWGRWSE